MQSLGIISGYENGSFHPNQEITRAEIVVILSLLTTFVPSESAFTDVISNNWSAGTISLFAAAGVVLGKGEGVFKLEKSAYQAESVAKWTVKIVHYVSNIKFFL